MGGDTHIVADTDAAVPEEDCIVLRETFRPISMLPLCASITTPQRVDILSPIRILPSRQRNRGRYSIFGRPPMVKDPPDNAARRRIRKPKFKH